MLNEELLSSVAVELTTVISPASTTFISKQRMCSPSPPPIRTWVSGGFIIKNMTYLSGIRLPLHQYWCTLKQVNSTLRILIFKPLLFPQ